MSTGGGEWYDNDLINRCKTLLRTCPAVTITIDDRKNAVGRIPAR